MLRWGKLELSSGVPAPNILFLPGIRQLQLLLLKVALLLGVEVHWGVTFTGLQPPPRKGKDTVFLGAPVYPGGLG